MKKFLTVEEEGELVAAIREQELRTTAEIRVCFTYKFIWRARRYAWRVFARTGMHRTRGRNAALVVMMPRVRKVVVIGDEAFDNRVPPEFWDNIVAAMIHSIHTEDPLASLRMGLRLLGDELARHWPRGQEDDPNELPDEVIR